MQPTRLAIAALALAIFTTGCATTGAGFSPLVDLRGKDQAAYSADLAACQQIAQQQAGAGESAMAGALAGALFGALLAAAAGGGISRNSMAGVGALSGGASAAGHGEQAQRDVIRRCLAGRGYLALN